MRRIITIILSIVSLNTLAQPSKFSRLIAVASYRNDGGSLLINDTTYYEYSSGRGGDLNSETLPCDTSTQLRYHAPAAKPIPYERRTKTYNSLDKLLVHTFQSQNAVSTTWNNERRIINTLDASNNVIAEEVQNWVGFWEPASLTKYSYNSLNSVINSTKFIWNNVSSNWDNSVKDASTYDSKNNKIQYQSWIWDMAGYKWDNASKITDTYDLNNDKVNSTSEKWDYSTNSWIFNAKTESTFDTKHNPILIQTYGYKLGAWKAYEYQEYTYNSMGNWIRSFRKQISPTTGVWYNFYKAFVDFDGLGRLIMFKNQFSKDGIDWEFYDSTQTIFDPSNEHSEEIRYRWNQSLNAYENAFKQNLTYNKFFQKTSATFSLWDKSGFWKAPSYYNHYYYEEYTTSISDAKNENGLLSLSPIPSNHKLNIDLAWETPQSFSVSIYNIHGMLIKYWTLPVRKQYKEAISLDEFTNGSYIILFKGERESQILRKFTVI